MSEELQHTVELTADIVAAYVSNNKILATDLPALVHEVSDALRQAEAKALQSVEEAPVPAISIKQSVKPGHIRCLECGKPFKSIKRHLRSAHDLGPAGYRAKWNLSRDYPLVAPDYAAARSKLAKKAGFGRK